MKATRQEEVAAVNGVGEIGPDGGIRGVSPSERSRMTPVVDPSGPSEAIARPRGFRSAYERKSRIRKVSMLIVCAGTLALLSAFAFGPLSLQKGTWGAHSEDVPIASFTATVTGGFHVMVDASASTSTDGIASYAWNFGDWILSSGKFHNHSYVTTGPYTITLNVTDTLGHSNTTTRNVSVVNSNPPPFPYIVYGTTFQSDGTTPLGLCTIAVTDVATQETLIGSTATGLTMSDADGLYSVDISPLFVTTGDGLVVSAVGPAGQTGSNTGSVDLAIPYVNVDVTLTTAIPEFTTLMVPIAGLLSIFVIMRLASGRAKK